MRRAPCPRCARPGGLPIAYGLPDADLFDLSERKEIHLGGCAIFADSPEFHCSFCGREWMDGPLPSWWPPEDAARMDPWDRQSAREELLRRVDDVRIVVDSLEIRGPDAATEVVAELAPQAPEPVVVPSDCVLLAEVVDAAMALCRTLEAGGELTLFDDDRRTSVEAAHQAFRRADAEYRARGDVDVLRDDDQIDDEDGEEDDDDPWMTDEDRFERAARAGKGSEWPEVGQEWHKRLDPVAEQVLGEGSATAWSRWVWLRLDQPPLTTEIDLARAGIRLVVLAELRRAFLERLDGDVPDDDPLCRVDNPGIEPYYVGYLAAADDVDPRYEIDSDEFEHPVEIEAFRELVRVECEHLRVKLAYDFGASQVFAHTWASRFTGTRYPLSPEAMDEALNNNLGPDKHIAFEWITEGMRL